MTIPLLEYAPAAQNQRVPGYEVPGDEQPRIYTTVTATTATTTSGIDNLIEAAYRQIFNEQQMLWSNRQPQLESQLKSGQITVKDFIRGLATSDSFRRLNYECNNNYRFVQLCVQRILGRDVYGDREKLAWSIVLATEGLNGFINALLNSAEYQSNFGEHTVPYQRRRILPQRAQGDLPFCRTPRYGADYRDKLPKSSYSPSTGLFNQFERFHWETFLQRANWPVVSGLLITSTVLIFFLLILSGSVNAAG